MCSDLLMIQAEQLLCHDMNLEDSSTNTAKCQSSKEHMNSARHAVN
jgi:hypothetical protein